MSLCFRVWMNSTGSSTVTMCPGGVGISVVEHGGRGRGLPGAGRANDQDEALPLHGELPQDGRQVEGFERRQLRLHPAAVSTRSRGANGLARCATAPTPALTLR